MKYIRQFAVILGISFLGEILHYLIPFPIPGSVYGLILMFLLLVRGILKIEDVRETVFDRDHAADVYSGGGRTGSILGAGKDDADPGMCDHGDIHGGCYGDCRESDGSLYSKAGRSGDQTKGRRSRKLVWKI